MTRLSFFKILAAVGMGQAATEKPCMQTLQFLTEYGPSGERTTKIVNGPCIPIPCADGEETCPLGHCQKPSAHLAAVPVDMAEYNRQEQMLMYYRGAWIVPSVCSTCGIVYVPMKP